MRFSNRTVLVTGGGSGIGRVMTHRFAAEGAAVLVADRLEDLSEKVARETEAAGGEALAVRADVSVWTDVDAMIALAEKEWGAIDVLVNNAAICTADDVVSMDENLWDRDVAVCLKGVFLCSKRALPRMMERRRGVILNIASVNGLGSFGNEAYSAAKAGVINLTQGLAVRYGPYGIRANAIAPGTIRTPIWQQRMEKQPGLFDRLKKWYPLGRVGEPEDVASAALFLASDDASWITGVVLRVDGGLLAGNGVMTRELLADFPEQ